MLPAIRADKIGADMVNGQRGWLEKEGERKVPKSMCSTCPRSHVFMHLSRRQPVKLKAMP